MLPCLSQYIASLTNSDGLCRTLPDLEVCRDENGRPIFHTGNSAVVFKVRTGDRYLRLKCYTRPVSADLEAIYGRRFLRGELFVFQGPASGVWTDVVADEWIEGRTLDETVRSAAEAGDQEALKALSARFDALAAEMLADDRAHGDLKPENIIVDREGRLLLIDFDAAFLPAFAGSRSPELGTEAYRHPQRTSETFDARLDDYPAVLISSALAALALDPALLASFPDADGLLFDPAEAVAGRSEALRRTLDLFAATGDALHYRIARLMTWPLPAVPDAACLFAATQRQSVPTDEVPRLFEQNGLWGYRTPRGEVTPALYDCGFEYSEGLAAVRIGRSWHYIDTAGKTVLDASAYEAVKPFRGGEAVVLKQGRRLRIDRSGRLLG